MMRSVRAPFGIVAKGLKVLAVPKMLQQVKGCLEQNMHLSTRSFITAFFDSY